MKDSNSDAITKIHKEHGQRERECEAVIGRVQFFVLSAELDGNFGGKFGAKLLQLRPDFVRTVVRSRPERLAETTAARCERMRRTSLGPRPTATLGDRSRANRDSARSIVQRRRRGCAVRLC